MPTIDRKFFDEAFSAYKGDKLKFETMLNSLNYSECLAFFIECSIAAKRTTRAAKSEVAVPKMDWVFGLKLMLVIIPLLMVNTTLWLTDALCNADWFQKTRGLIRGIIGKVFGKEWNDCYDSIKSSAQYRNDISGMISYATKVMQNNNFGFNGGKDFEDLFNFLLPATRTVVFRKIQGSGAIYRQVETGKIFIPMDYTTGNLALINEIRESGINVTKEKDFIIKQCPEYKDWWILDPQRKTTEDNLSKEQSDLERNLLLKLREIEKAFLAKRGDSPDRSISK